MTDLMHPEDPGVMLRDLRRQLNEARGSARMGWELVHRLAQRFDLPHCEEAADRALSKLKEE